MSRPLEPTTTHFAILGMLAIRPFSSYELANRFDRSMRPFWPRARSKLFEAPKHLVSMGFARASQEKTGRRSRTVYAITPKGRRALASWLSIPGSGPELEFEQLLKVFYGEHANKDAMLANIDAAAAWARAKVEHDIAVGRSYLDGTGPFQDRAAVLVLTGGFLGEFALIVDRWAGWARGIVETWPEDPARAVPDLHALEEIVRRLEQRARTWARSDDAAGGRAYSRARVPPGTRAAADGSSSRRRAARRAAGAARRSG